MRGRGGAWQGARPACSFCRSPQTPSFHGILGGEGHCRITLEEFVTFNQPGIGLGPPPRMSTALWAFPVEAAPISEVLWKTCEPLAASNYRIWEMDVLACKCDQGGSPIAAPTRELRVGMVSFNGIAKLFPKCLCQ